MKAHLISNVQAFTVQVVNRGTWVELSETRYVVAPSQSITIPVEFTGGSDPSCVSVTNVDQVTPTGFTINNVASDIVVTITDTKSKVTLINGDPMSIASITPSTQFVPTGTSATFTLTYNQGYDSSCIQVDRGDNITTISGTTVTVNATEHENTASLTAKQYRIMFYQYAPWVINTGRTYTVRKGSNYTIPLGYTEEADYRTITASNGTLDSKGVTLSNISSDITCRIEPSKGQVTYDLQTAVFSSISPTYAYGTPGGNVDISFSLNSGYSSSAIVLSEGYVSGNHIYVPVSSVYDKKKLIIRDNLPKVAIGGLDQFSYRFPLEDQYYYTISEQLYKYEEIGRSGKIVQIGFYVKTGKTRTIELYLGNTTYTTMRNNWIPMYSYNFYGSVAFKDGWNFINLSNPFTLNSGYNLVLCVNDITARQTYDMRFASHDSGFTSSSRQSNYSNRYYASNSYSDYGDSERTSIQLVFAN